MMSLKYLIVYECLREQFEPWNFPVSQTQLLCHFDMNFLDVFLSCEHNDSENISILDIGCTVRPPLSASAHFTNSVRGLFLLEKMLWDCFLITILISYIKCLQLCNSALQYVSCDVNFVVVLLVSYNSGCIIIGYLLT